MSVPPSENPHAGGNAVVLDIGGDIGALVVRMPREMLGVEIQLEPADAGGSDGQGHGHGHGLVHHPHRAVVDRPLHWGHTVPSLVFEAVTAGDYVLRVLPQGPPAVPVTVGGGSVTEAVWPGRDGDD